MRATFDENVFSGRDASVRPALALSGSTFTVSDTSVGRETSITMLETASQCAREDASAMKLREKLLTITVVAGLASSYASASGPAAQPSAETALGNAGASEQGPSVSIATHAVEAAGAFERYFRSAAAVSSDFDGPAAVSGALMAGAAYDPHQLEEGAVAYASLMALQQPTFVDAFSTFSADPAERRAYIERLTAAPDQILAVPGAMQAAALASGALAEMGSRLVSRGHAVTQAAYSVQQQPWASEPVPQPAERLARVREAGGKPGRLSESETHQLLTRIVRSRVAADAAAAQSRPTPTVLRGLVLAAAAILGQAKEKQAHALSAVLREPENGACLRRAKLNLHQCVAASGPQYEDVFCAGKHAMAETGQCIVLAAGGVATDGVKAPIVGDYAQDASATVSVPVARPTVAQPSVEPRGQTPEDAYSEEERAAPSD